VKGPKNRFSWAALSLAALLAVASSVQAQIATLVDNNSSAIINLNGSGNTAGMINWTVDGINQLSQQWFWFRAGSMNSEQAINTIGGLTITQPNLRTLYTSYFNGQFGVRVDYLLTGFSLGSGISDISESISITNASASPLEFHFFQYSYFALGGNPGDTTVQLGKNLRGLYNEASVTKNNPIYSVALSETVVSPGANHGEVALYPDTLGRLSDGGPTTLNDNSGPISTVGTNGPTWAFEWDFVIAPGSSVGISKDKYLQVRLVPEPSTAALLGLGALTSVLICRRKRSR